MKIFTDRLKELRKEKKLTQQRVAKELEISTTCYAGYEQGYREPGLALVKKICLFYNVSADYLLGLDD